MRPCTICGHPRRDEIDAALRDHVRYETVAARFKTSLMSILTHRGHLDGLGTPPAGPASAEEIRETHEASVESLLDQMRGLYEKSYALLQTAEASSEPRRISLALVQIRRNLKALGDLTEHVRQRLRASRQTTTRSE